MNDQEGIDIEAVKEKAIDDVSREEQPSWDEVLQWIEFGCWSALAILPLLYFINGPAVSTDQFVVRVTVVVVAIVGGVCSRLVRLKMRSSTTNEAPFSIRS